MMRCRPTMQPSSRLLASSWRTCAKSTTRTMGLGSSPAPSNTMRTLEQMNCSLPGTENHARMGCSWLMTERITSARRASGMGEKKVANMEGRVASVCEYPNFLLYTSKSPVCALYTRIPVRRKPMIRCRGYFFDSRSIFSLGASSSQVFVPIFRSITEGLLYPKVRSSRAMKRPLIPFSSTSFTPWNLGIHFVNSGYFSAMVV